MYILDMQTLIQVWWKKRGTEERLYIVFLFGWRLLALTEVVRAAEVSYHKSNLRL